MEQFSLVTIINIILNIIAIYWLIIDLYQVYHHEKCIIKIKEKESLSVLWVILFIIACIILLFNISDYIKYKEMRIINNTLINTFWLETTMLKVITLLRGLEIRENGIYNSGYLYKWTKIQNYSLILPNKIQLEVKDIFGVHSINIKIKEDFILSVDKIINSFRNSSCS